MAAVKVAENRSIGLVLRRLALALALLAALAGFAPQDQTSTAGDSERRIFRSFLDGDYASAAKLIDEELARSPRDVTLLYNGACAYSRLGETEKAANYLFRAVEAGFRDFDHMRQDPDLEAIRDHEIFTAILEAANRVAAKQDRAKPPARPRSRTNALEDWRSTYGETDYRYETDEKRGLVYATALDEDSHRRMREMLEREWDELTQWLFEGRPKYDVLIAVPTPQHARELLPQERIGGIYEHSLHRLIARNIGGSLRHEFFHLVHYRDMEQRSQLHRLWVQEGLASLYEDYRFLPDGSIQFEPNERHNRVKALAAAGRLEKWTEFFELPDDVFMRRASDLYPQVRSIFEFVASRGLLRTWYRDYVGRYKDDSSGAKTFEAVFGDSLANVERQWRLWLTSRPVIDTEIRMGDAALGVRIKPRESNDGVVVAGVIPGSAAAGSGLRTGDVIVAIDGQPTPTESELVMIVAARRVGEVVEVRARRGTEYVTAVLTLRPLGSR